MKEKQRKRQRMPTQSFHFHIGLYCISLDRRQLPPSKLPSFQFPSSQLPPFQSFLHHCPPPFVMFHCFIHSFSVGAHDPFVTFYARNASYLLFQGSRCCPDAARLTLTIWLKLAELPAILFSTKNSLSSDEVALTIDSNGTLSFLLNNASIRYEKNR